MRTSRDPIIESLKQELQRLEITSQNLRKLISDLKEQEQSSSGDTSATDRVRRDKSSDIRSGTPTVRDRYGNIILIGSTVDFLTKGKIPLSSGVVQRFSKNYERVFAIDNLGREIARAPSNLHVRSRDVVYSDHVE